MNANRSTTALAIATTTTTTNTTNNDNNTIDNNDNSHTRQTYNPRSLCTQSPLHALRSLFSSLLLVFPVYIELRR